MKFKVPVYGCEHSQFGLITLFELHSMDAQLFDGIKFEELGF